MLKLYSERDVKRLVQRLREEYDGVLARQREAAEGIKQENRVLRARVLELEEERSGVAAALIAASQEGERLKEAGAREIEGQKRELELLAEKCRTFLDRLQKKYPDEEDTAEFAAFCDELFARLGLEEPQSGFNMDDVISPKGPLDLKQLCRDLGLIEEDQ